MTEKKREWPELTQQSVIHVDGTPDNEYPIRILQAYRENCNCHWSDNTAGDEPLNPLYKAMNEQQVERAKILDAAIRVLEKAHFTND